MTRLKNNSITNTKGKTQMGKSNKSKPSNGANFLTFYVNEEHRQHQTRLVVHGYADPVFLFV